MNKKGGLATKFLLGLMILFLLVTAGLSYAIYSILGKEKIIDIFTTEKISHNCDLEDHYCLEKTIGLDWKHFGCGKLKINNTESIIQSNPGTVTCIALDEELNPNMQNLSLKDVSKLLTLRMRFYCCDEAVCEEAKTYFFAEFIKDINKDDSAVEERIKKDVPCLVKMGLEE